MADHRWRFSLAQAVLAVAVIASVVGGALGAPATTAEAPPSVYSDVVFGVPSGTVLRLDIHRMDSVPRPAVVLVHGGGWAGGDKTTWTEEATALAKAGFVVFNINYRLACTSTSNDLCGHHGWTMVRDVRTAVEWVRANGERYGALTSRVGVVGSSAGGHMAMLTATTGDDRPDAVVSLSGPTTLMPPLRGNIDGNERVEAAAQRFVGCAYADCRAKWRELSPVRQVERGAKPMYIVHAAGDRLVPAYHAAVMYGAVRKAGTKGSLRVFDNTSHGEGLFSRALPGLSYFLHSHVG